MRMGKMKAVILAAGAGTRMKSEKPKVIHKICGKPLVEHVIEAVQEANISEICIVIGHQGEQVKAAIKENVVFVEQKERLGTGHAVMQAEEFLKEEGTVIILAGDTPMVTGESIKTFMEYHETSENAVTVWTAHFENPFGYGRIIRDENGNFVKIVEQKDASQEEAAVQEINSGIYCFDIKALKEALSQIDNKNAQGEYYLPDTLEIILQKGLKVDALQLQDATEILGINSRVQLAEAEAVMRKRINTFHMMQGVTLMDPSNTYIEKGVKIGKDTILYPGCILEGKTEIGESCILGQNTRIVDSNIGNNTEVQMSVVIDSKIDEHTHVGPFAYIRPGSSIGSHVKVGDFVEVKNSSIGDHTKISHLTYVGDATVGKNVNFGCGTVVVNYDGEKKHRTIIEDDAFIGCNTNLVSPVVVREGAYTAAGSTITKDVPQNALGIARVRQENKEKWALKRKNKKK